MLSLASILAQTPHKRELELYLVGDGREQISDFGEHASRPTEAIIFKHHSLRTLF
jgi:hypothetical protein